MSKQKITLKGITWDHSRGLVPMVATSQRFNELHPNIDIKWDKRSLQEFADYSIEELAARYDLLIIDHPWAGFAARNKNILPLDEYLSKDFMKDQEENSVGRSFESYSFNGHQWALPTDACAPVASSRPDILKKHGLDRPKTLEDLFVLAEKGLVAFAGIPIDSLMNFYMFCCAFGEEPCVNDEIVVSEETGTKVLETMRKLGKNLDPKCFERNPIKTYEAMTQTDEIAYCPFAYGYSNYARRGFARKRLEFHDLITVNGKPLQSTLGGTGLAISSTSKHIEEAVKYAEFANSEAVQSTIYTDNGGQPGHRKAWLDEENNRITNNYFKDTLPALDRSYLRPRYHGSMYFQDNGGDYVREFMMNGGNPTQVLDKLNVLYRESKQEEQESANI